MTYILINSSELIQTQFETNNIDDIEKEFFGRTSHDIELLGSLQLLSNTSVIYDKYTIYKINYAPISRYPIILDIIKYDMNKNTFVHMAINRVHINQEHCCTGIQKTVSNQQKIIKQQSHDIPFDAHNDDASVRYYNFGRQENHYTDYRNMKPETNMFDRDVDCRHTKKENKCDDSDTCDIDEYMKVDDDDDSNCHEMNDSENEKNDTSDDNESDNDKSDKESETNKDPDIENIEDVDDNVLIDIKKQIDEMKQRRDERIKQMKEAEKQREELRPKVAEMLSDVSAKMKDHFREQQKIDDFIRKFNTDRETYYKIKLENLTSLDQLPPFFVNTYIIMKNMDSQGELNKQDAFSKFFNNYVKYIEKNYDTIKEENDPYGIIDMIDDPQHASKCD